MKSRVLPSGNILALDCNVEAQIAEKYGQAGPFGIPSRCWLSQFTTCIALPTRESATL
jgi:hypothetical protein